jgi:subtilisin family serine protease
VVFDLPRGGSLAKTLERLAADPRVETVQPIYTFTALGGRDPYLHLQRGAGAQGLAPVHRFATGKGVKVALIDTGVDVHHPDLAGRIRRTGNFVGAGAVAGDFYRDIHGTAVAGILAASADNDVGIAGVAPGAEVFALKACWQPAPDDASAVCDSYSLVKALDYALDQEAQVVNLSLAGPRDPLLARLIATAVGRGVAVVAAAAPAGANGGGAGFPASLDGVIAVRASGGPGLGPGEPAAPAALGRQLAAPGVDILTTVPGGGYDFFSGSSMAAAQVAGVVALLLERQPGLAPERVAGLLRDTAQPAAAPPDGSLPPGTAIEAQVDACGAVSELLGVAACGPLPAARVVR